MNVVAVAHLVYGYLGAGKTTFSKRLASELQAVRYSPDEWLVALYGQDPPENEFAEYSRRVLALINTQWPVVLARGVDVVLDFGFWSRGSRDAARMGAFEAGGGSRLYSLTCEEAVARARCQKRNHSHDGSLFIADATFDLLKSRFEPLGADEHFESVPQ